METIWNGASPSFKKLNQNIICDTAIIGGGIAGLWCAYKLTKAGQKVCVLEANKIASGVTAGSTAILTYAQDIIYASLIAKHGIEIAKQYLSDTKNAINSIKNEKLSCDLEEIDFVLFTNKFCGKLKLNKEKKAYKKLGDIIEETDAKGLPYKVKKAFVFKKSLQINPVKLCVELARYIVKNGGQIFEGTLVHDSPQKEKLKVGKYIVTAKHFIAATHFPYIKLPGFYFLKMYQSQNYAIAFKALDKEFCKGISYESIDKAGFEYRRVGKNILCDGVSVRTGEKPYHSKYQIIEKHLKKYFDVKEIVRYVAQDCITMDNLPYAGLYSNFLDNVYIVSGFNKWGMTNAYITSDVVCNMILKKMPKENIYAPSRNDLFAGIIETVENVGHVAASFANDLLNVDAKEFSRIKNGQGAIVKHKGKRVGAYRDPKGKLHLISGICPHLGCNLTWNKDELTFDCPCHGSRFDYDGQIINNPSTEPAHKIK